MYIFLWIVFVVLWLPAGAVAYRFTRFFESIDYDKVWTRTNRYQAKEWRNTAILFGYFSLIITALSITIVITFCIFLYGKKFLLILTGK